MKQKILISVLAACFLLAIFGPAHAATTTTPEGVAQLKKIIEKYLDYQKSYISLEGAGDLQLDGDIIVEPQDTYYAVTLPHAKIAYADGSRIEVGIISINASPADKAGRWKMSVAVPTPMITFDKDSNQVARISIGGQRFAGVWDDDMESFIKLDSAYKDITIDSANPAHNIVIGETQIRFDFSADEKNLWSGPGFASLKDIRADLSHADTSLTLGELKMDFALKQYNPAAIKIYREQLKALADSTTPDAATQQGNTQARALGIYNMVMDLIFKSGDGFTSQYSMTDLHLAQPGGHDVAFKNGYFGFDMTGFLQDKVKMALRAGYNGFSMTPAPAGYAEVQPKDINVDLTLENLPFKQIADISKNTMISSIDDPQSAQLAGLTLMLKLPAILGQSGTFMTIKDNYIGNDQYKFELNGTARADIAAVNSVTAELKGVFSGLERLLASTHNLASAQKADGTAKTGVEAENAIKFRDLNETLTKLKGVGKVEARETAAGSESVHIFDLIMDQTGKILLNGQDLFAVLNAPVAAPVAPVDPAIPAAEPTPTP